MAKFLVLVDDGGNILAITRDPNESTTFQDVKQAAKGIGQLAAIIRGNPVGVGKADLDHAAYETTPGLLLGDRVRESERLTPDQRGAIFHILDNRLPALDEWQLVRQDDPRAVEFGELSTWRPDPPATDAGGAAMLKTLYFLDP